MSAGALTPLVTNMSSDLIPTPEEPVMDWGSYSLFNNLTEMPDAASTGIDLVDSIFNDMSTDVLPQTSPQINLRGGKFFFFFKFDNSLYY